MFDRERAAKIRKDYLKRQVEDAYKVSRERDELKEELERAKNEIADLKMKLGDIGDMLEKSGIDFGDMDIPEAVSHLIGLAKKGG